MAVPTINPNQTFQENVQPAAAVQPNPAPQIQTPAAPTTPPAPVTVNVGTPDTAPVTPAKPQNAAVSPGGLQMPATGSVVDLLNAAGTDSSYENRQKLAQQYGIQGYSGTAAQNIDLSKKYLDAFNANKDSPTPESGSQGRTALDSYFNENQKHDEDPQKAFFDQYMSMNPIVKNLYDGFQQAVSTPVTSDFFKEEYQNLVKSSGVEGLKTELMNIDNLMDGTEDSIRSEIAASGGFATENQVQALAAARNKTFLRQATALQQQIALKEDYIKNIMNFSQMDREKVEKDIDRKLGLTEKLSDLQDKMTNAAKENFQAIVNDAGYAGLASLFQSDPTAMKQAEKVLGLPGGALSNKDFLSIGNKPGEQFTLSPGSIRFDSNGNIIAKAPTAAASNAGGIGTGATPGPLSDLARAVQNGTIALDKIPIAQRSAIAAELARSGIPSDRQNTLSSSLSVVNSLLNNSSLSKISGVPGLSVLVPGTQAQLALNQYNQLKGILSLENRQLLKGSGAISDFEFRVLQDAATALGRNLADKDFKSQLEKVRDVFSGKYALTTKVTADGKPEQMTLPNGSVVKLQADGTYK